MLSPRLYRKYRLKFYLNMSHFVSFNGKNGEPHPHTWEFVMEIVINGDGFVEFNMFEKVIESYMDKFQNKLLNDIDPFDVINPTLENVSDFFAGDLRDLIAEKGGYLVIFEGSETPTRTYILSFENETDYMTRFKELTDERIENIVDSMINTIKEKTEE